MGEIALLDPGHSIKQPSTLFTGWSTSAKELFAGKYRDALASTWFIIRDQC